MGKEVGRYLGGDGMFHSQGDPGMWRGRATGGTVWLEWGDGKEVKSCGSVFWRAWHTTSATLCLFTFTLNEIGSLWKENFHNTEK
jgi:hypothetical protein